MSLERPTRVRLERRVFTVCFLAFALLGASKTVAGGLQELYETGQCPMCDLQGV